MVLAKTILYYEMDGNVFFRNTNMFEYVCICMYCLCVCDLQVQKSIKLLHRYKKSLIRGEKLKGDGAIN